MKTYENIILPTALCLASVGFAAYFVYADCWLGEKHSWAIFISAGAAVYFKWRWAGIKQDDEKARAK